MSETSPTEKSQSSSVDAEQHELLISKAQEGFVETTSQPNGAKKEGHFTTTLVFAILAVTIGSSFQFGYHIGCVNVPGALMKQFVNTSFYTMHNITVDETQLKVLWAFTVTMFPFGGMFGGIMVGFSADRFGRKMTLLCNNALAVIAAVLMTLAKHVGNFWLIAIGRFIIGLNAGLNSGLAPMYLMEISPANLRGCIGSLAQLFVTVSILVSQIIGLPAFLGTKELWPYIFAITFVPVVFQLCTLPLCPESPKFILACKGRKDEAEQNLKKLRGEDDVSTELDQMNEAALSASDQPKVRMSAMFLPPLQWPLLLATFMMVSQQWSGINAVMFYSTVIFKAAGLNDEWANYATLMMGGINVAMTVGSVYMVDRLGRRTLHLIGMAGMLLTTALIAGTTLGAEKFSNITLFSYASILLVLLFVVSFATGPGSIPWFYVNELFPSNALGNANSIAVLTNWLANTFLAISFEPLQHLIGGYVFFIFTAFLALFIAFAYKFLPETKHKTLEEIQAEMDKLRGATRTDPSMITTDPTMSGRASTNV